MVNSWGSEGRSQFSLSRNLGYYTIIIIILRCHCNYSIMVVEINCLSNFHYLEGRQALLIMLKINEKIKSKLKKIWCQFQMIHRVSIKSLFSKLYKEFLKSLTSSAGWPVNFCSCKIIPLIFS